MNKDQWLEKQRLTLEVQWPSISIRLYNAFLYYYPSTCLWKKYPALEFEDFLALKETDLLRLRHVGPKTLQQIGRLRQHHTPISPPGVRAPLWADAEWDHWAETLPGWSHKEPPCP